MLNKHALTLITQNTSAAQIINPFNVLKKHKITYFCTVLDIKKTHLDNKPRANKY